MKHFLMLTAALAACAFQPAEAAERNICLIVADAALEVADMGRRGVPVTQAMASVTEDNEVTAVTMRRFIVQAYERGAAGETMADIWDSYFASCKANQAKEERPS